MGEPPAPPDESIPVTVIVVPSCRTICGTASSGQVHPERAPHVRVCTPNDVVEGNAKATPRALASGRYGRNIGSPAGMTTYSPFSSGSPLRTVRVETLPALVTIWRWIV